MLISLSSVADDKIHGSCPHCPHPAVTWRGTVEFFSSFGWRMNVQGYHCYPPPRIGPQVGWKQLETCLCGSRSWLPVYRNKMTRGSPTPCGCPNYVQFIVGKELGLQVVAKSTQGTTAEIRGQSYIVWKDQPWTYRVQAMTLGEACQLSEPVFSSVKQVCSLQEAACWQGWLIFVTCSRMNVWTRHGPACLPVSQSFSSQRFYPYMKSTPLLPFIVGGLHIAASFMEGSLVKPIKI